MKSTKKYLSTSVVLAIALFAAIQITAMEPGRKVNPHLSKTQKDMLEYEIQKAEGFLDPKSESVMRGSGLFISQQQAKVEGLKEIYYGNKPYTDQQIEDTLWNHKRRAMLQGNS